MNLVAKKKFGQPGTVVRAGRILKVVKNHPLKSAGENLDCKTDRFKESDWVFCEEGDLLVEVFKKKKLLGWSFLSGKAVGMMHYTDDAIGQYEPSGVPLRLVKIPDMGTFDDPKTFFYATLDQLKKSKEGPMSISVFSIDVEDDIEADAACTGLANFWGSLSGTGHLMGNIEYKRGTKGRGGLMMHSQPPEHAGNEYVTPFQVSLLLEKAKKQKQKHN